MLGVLCIIGSCAVNKGLHLCRHTFASLWGHCLRFASLWRANSRGDSLGLGVHFSNVFWDLLLFVFVKRAYFKSFLKVYYRSVFIESSKVVFWKWVRLLTHASMKPGCLARRLLCHKVNLPRCEARRRHFIMTCDIFGTGQTNILTLCYLLGKLIIQPTVALHSSHWNQHTRPNYWKGYWRKHTHIPLKTLMIPLKRVSEPVSKHNSLCSSAHHKKCGLGSLISTQVKETCQ